MPDVEKVIKGLECCMLSYKDGCDECPYISKGMCQELLGEDAIALLKAQKPRVLAGAELTDTELIEKIRKAPITLKPAVDAVPVEWLKKVRKYASEGDSLDVGIAEVLDMWEKEQEVV